MSDPQEPHKLSAHGRYHTVNAQEEDAACQAGPGEHDTRDAVQAQGVAFQAGHAARTVRRTRGDLPCLQLRAARPGEKSTAVLGVASRLWSRNVSNSSTVQ